MLCMLIITMLRKKKPDMRRPNKMPGYPVTTILAIVITCAICLTCSGEQMLKAFY